MGNLNFQHLHVCKQTIHKFKIAVVDIMLALLGLQITIYHQIILSEKDPLL